MSRFQGAALAPHRNLAALCLFLTLVAALVCIGSGTGFDIAGAIPAFTVMASMYLAFFYLLFRHAKPTFITPFFLLASMIYSMLISGTIAAASLRFRFPLIDEHLASFDSFLPINAAQCITFVNKSGTFIDFLHFLYMIAPLLCFFGVIALTMIERHQQSLELGLSFVICVGVCGLISIFIPDAGTFHFYNFGIDMRNNLPGLAGIYYMEQFFAYRDNNLTSINWANLKGLVNFPSFHACMAFIPILATRSVPRMMWPLLVLLPFSLLATVVMGGHYIADIVAGALLSLVVQPVASRLAQSISAADSKGFREILTPASAQ